MMKAWLDWFGALPVVAFVVAVIFCPKAFSTKSLLVGLPLGVMVVGLSLIHVTAEIVLLTAGVGSVVIVWILEDA